MSFPWAQREGQEWGGRRGTPSQELPERGLALPSARRGERERRVAQHAEAHLQPRVTPRAIGRSHFQRAASGASVGFVGEVRWERHEIYIMFGEMRARAECAALLLVTGVFIHTRMKSPSSHA